MQTTTAILPAVRHPGHPLLFTLQLRKHQLSLLRYSRFLCRSLPAGNELARDLLQDSLEVAWNRFSQLSDPDGFRGWVARIIELKARNLARHELKYDCHNRSDDSGQLVEEIGSTESLPISTVMEMRAALTHLSRPERKILLLHTLAGLTIQELSALEDCSISCMKKRLERARTKMRHWMLNGAHTTNRETLIASILDETFLLFESALATHSFDDSSNLKEH